MRSLTSLTAVAVLLTLGACTSGDPDETAAPSSGATTEDAAQTSGPSGPSASGYLCDDISPQSLRALAGGELSDPTQVMLQDDDTAWICEARDGETPIARLSLSVGEEARDQARARAQEAEGVQEGPEYLGESYLSPDLATGLTLCKDLGAPEGETYEPYTMVAEALVEGEEDYSNALRSTLTTLATRLDQGLGCTPKQAREDAANATAP